MTSFVSVKGPSLTSCWAPRIRTVAASSPGRSRSQPIHFPCARRSAWSRSCVFMTASISAGPTFAHAAWSSKIINRNFMVAPPCGFSFPDGSDLDRAIDERDATRPGDCLVHGAGLDDVVAAHHLLRFRERSVGHVASLGVHEVERLRLARRAESEGADEAPLGAQGGTEGIVGVHDPLLLLRGDGVPLSRDVGEHEQVLHDGILLAQGNSLGLHNHTTNGERK